jgi:hypothetical protein
LWGRLFILRRSRVRLFLLRDPFTMTRNEIFWLIIDV